MERSGVGGKCPSPHKLRMVAGTRYEGQKNKFLEEEDFLRQPDGELVPVAHEQDLVVGELGGLLIYASIS